MNAAYACMVDEAASLGLSRHELYAQMMAPGWGTPSSGRSASYPEQGSLEGDWLPEGLTMDDLVEAD